jgi:hypothetical protein
MILTSTFGRVDEYLGSDSVKEETASIVAEVTGVSGATVTGLGYWKKTVDSTKLEIKVANKVGTISTQPTLTVTQPTVSITNPSISVSFDLTAPESSGGGSGGGP